MATLEDKIFGEKKHYYCSSSSEEDNIEDDGSKKEDTLSKWSGLSKNTGPKGVLEDWQKYNELKNYQIEQDQKKYLELIKKRSLTCKSVSEDEKDVNDESFIHEYRKKRMMEMLSEMSTKPAFGKVINLSTPDEFLKEVDGEDADVVVIIHMYEDHDINSKKINEIFIEICKEYGNVKFCKMLASTAGLSINFKMSGIPAFLVYKDKQLINNLIKITDELGEDFCQGDLENYFIERGILNNRIPVQSMSNQMSVEDDSD